MSREGRFTAAALKFQGGTRASSAHPLGTRCPPGTERARGCVHGTLGFINLLAL